MVIHQPGIPLLRSPSFHKKQGLQAQLSQATAISWIQLRRQKETTVQKSKGQKETVFSLGALPCRHQLLYSCLDPGWDAGWARLAGEYLSLYLEDSWEFSEQVGDKRFVPKQCRACPVTVTYCGPKERLFGPCDHSSVGVSKRHLVVTGRPRSFCHPITIPLSQPHPGCGRQKAEGPLPSAFQRQAWVDCSICRWARCVWGSGHR